MKKLFALCVMLLSAVTIFAVTISRNSGNIQIQWDATNGNNYTIETATVPSGPWTNAPTTPTTLTATSNKLAYTFPLASTVRFFRIVDQGSGNDFEPAMVSIPAGSFVMGDSFSEGDIVERPTHTVQISAFRMDKNLVTVAVWNEVMLWAATNGYNFSDSSSNTPSATELPHPNVTWYDAAKWCNARSQKRGLTPCYYTDSSQSKVYESGEASLFGNYVKWTANGYRLPTEAEWEKGARGGLVGMRFPNGNTITHSQANYTSSDSYAYDVSPTRGWHPYSSTHSTFLTPAGYLAPNGYGLYDMAGDVAEWCWDFYDPNWYSQAGATNTDTRGQVLSQPNRVTRGGAWYDEAPYVRCAARGANNADVAGNIGFRTVRSP